MNELISRKATKEHICAVYRTSYRDGFEVDKHLTLECIDNTPTIDAVEVVRCRDCEKSGVCCPDEQPAYRYCFCHSTEVSDNDFCSYGKRKEEHNGKAD